MGIRRYQTEVRSHHSTDSICTSAPPELAYFAPLCSFYPQGLYFRIRWRCGSYSRRRSSPGHDEKWTTVCATFVLTVLRYGLSNLLQYLILSYRSPCNSRLRPSQHRPVSTIEALLRIPPRLRRAKYYYSYLHASTCSIICLWSHAYELNIWTNIKDGVLDQVLWLTSLALKRIEEHRRASRHHSLPFRV